MSEPMVLAFADLRDIAGCNDAVAAAGGKGASLCRMSAEGLPVPPGFVVCSSAFQTFFEECGGTALARELTADLDVACDKTLEETAGRLRGVVLDHPLPARITGLGGVPPDGRSLYARRAVRRAIHQLAFGQFPVGEARDLLVLLPAAGDDIVAVIPDDAGDRRGYCSLPCALLHHPERAARIYDTAGGGSVPGKPAIILPEYSGGVHGTHL